MAKYKTSISTHHNGKPYVYGYDLTKLAESPSFTRTIYLILMGKMPDKNGERMLDAIFTIAIDHGVEPSSVVAARNVYSAGSPVQAAVAAGVLAFGEFHGGAIEQTMENFKKWQSVGAAEMVADFTSLAAIENNFFAISPSIVSPDSSMAETITASSASKDSMV